MILAGRWLLLPVGAEQLSLPFVHANLNKRSIVLDMHQAQDQERFRALARQADRGEHRGCGGLGQSWVDVRALRRLPADLDLLTPFGLSGPYSAYVGNNIVAEAMGASCTFR